MTAISSVVIPKTVKTLSNFAFSTCGNLTSVIIEEGVESIVDETFGNIDGLSHVEIPNSVKIINEYAFSGSKSNLTIITLAGSFAEQYAKENEITCIAQ